MYPNLVSFQSGKPSLQVHYGYGWCIHEDLWEWVANVHARSERQGDSWVIELTTQGAISRINCPSIVVFNDVGF